MLSALILEHLGANCDEFRDHTTKLSGSLGIGAKIELFHFKGATYSTSFLFTNLLALLKNCLPLIDDDKTAETLPQQLSFLNAIKVLHANLKSLALTQLSLGDILTPTEKDDFLSVFKASVVKIDESGYTRPL